MWVFCRRITLALKAQSVADAASLQVSLQARVAGHTRGKTGDPESCKHVAEGSAMIRLGEEKQRDRAPEVRAPKGDLVKLHIRMPEVRQDGMHRGLFRAPASSTVPALASSPAPKPLAWKPLTEVLEDDEEEPPQRPAVVPATFEDVAPAGSTASSAIAGGPAATETSDLGGRGVTMGASSRRHGAVSAPPFLLVGSVFRPVSTLSRAASP